MAAGAGEFGLRCRSNDWLYNPQSTLGNSGPLGCSYDHVLSDARRPWRAVHGRQEPAAGGGSSDRAAVPLEGPAVEAVRAVPLERIPRRPGDLISERPGRVADH